MICSKDAASAHLHLEVANGFLINQQTFLGLFGPAPEFREMKRASR